MAIGDVDLEGISGYSTCDLLGKCSSTGFLDGRDVEVLNRTSPSLDHLKKVAARSFAYCQHSISGAVVGMSCTKYINQASGEVTVTPKGDVTVKSTVHFRQPPEEKKPNPPSNKTPAKSPPKNPNNSGKTPAKSSPKNPSNSG